MRVAGPAATLWRGGALFAGIDTHKDTLAVAVVNENGRRVAAEQVPNTEPGFLRLVELLESHRVVRVGIEGSGNFGRAIAVHLVISWAPAWETTVVEVPTLMTSRERRAQVGRGKTDPVDALAIARIAAREQGLPPVRLTVGPASPRPCQSSPTTSTPPPSSPKPPGPRSAIPASSHRSELSYDDSPRTSKTGSRPTPTTRPAVTSSPSRSARTGSALCPRRCSTHSNMPRRWRAATRRRPRRRSAPGLVRSPRVPRPKGRSSRGTSPTHCQLLHRGLEGAGCEAKAVALRERCDTCDGPTEDGLHEGYFVSMLATLNGHRSQLLAHAG